MFGDTKYLGWIGSAVLTFIGYIQTKTHPDKQRIYVEVVISVCLDVRS